ncbi:Protein kinase-like domain [Pseudocohnilembus persalinus]|uniref:Protein kinase-like domain n=1 Tax=Pseudocohnilembus persalinus TaxID=266149 RepID=A0A0V0R732_PSEPJ|nr:Protein kinase-like domain [Pseudocohnilembus persalinus]|eukprot:KRX10308.1 Protein kinase-like domain [Pseudocohnilembus persalinus]
MAIKILSQAQLKSQTYIVHDNEGRPKRKNMYENFQKEIEIMKKINHTNTIKLYEVIQNQDYDKIYLIQEYAENGQILEWDRLNNHFTVNKCIWPLNEKLLRQLIREMIKGVDSLHQSNIIHRDLKPSNILLNKNKNIKIADFGLSTLVNEDDEEDVNFNDGTYQFMAPEYFKDSMTQIVQKKDLLKIMKESDIWALGVTFYCLVYKKLPFYDVNQLKLFQKIQNSKLTFPLFPSISSELKSIIKKMLNKNPQERITINELVENEWINQGMTPLKLEMEQEILENLEEEIDTIYDNQKNNQAIFLKLFADKQQQQVYSRSQSSVNLCQKQNNFVINDKDSNIYYEVKQNQKHTLSQEPSKNFFDSYDFQDFKQKEDHQFPNNSKIRYASVNQHNRYNNLNASSRTSYSNNKNQMQVSKQNLCNTSFFEDKNYELNSNLVDKLNINKFLQGGDTYIMKQSTIKDKDKYSTNNTKNTINYNNGDNRAQTYRLQQFHTQNQNFNQNDNELQNRNKNHTFSTIDNYSKQNNQTYSAQNNNNTLEDFQTFQNRNKFEQSSRKQTKKNSQFYSGNQKFNSAITADKSWITKEMETYFPEIYDEQTSSQEVKQIQTRHNIFMPNQGQNKSMINQINNNNFTRNCNINNQLSNQSNIKSSQVINLNGNLSNINNNFSDLKGIKNLEKSWGYIENSKNLNRSKLLEKSLGYIENSRNLNKSKFLEKSLGYIENSRNLNRSIIYSKMIQTGGTARFEGENERFSMKNVDGDTFNELNKNTNIHQYQQQNGNQSQILNQNQKQYKKKPSNYNNQNALLYSFNIGGQIQQSQDLKKSVSGFNFQGLQAVETSKIGSVSNFGQSPNNVNNNNSFNNANNNNSFYNNNMNNNNNHFHTINEPPFTKTITDSQLSSTSSI